MELKGKYLIIWITDDAAKLFLGAARQSEMSRWAIWGKCVDADHQFFWIDIDYIDEAQSHQGHKHWRVKPQIASINRNWIITVQVAGDNAPDSKEIGFTSQSPTR